MKFLIHPILVHYPIAFYLLELMLLLLWTIRRDPAYFQFARFIFKLGFAAMLFAIGGGLFDVEGFAGIQGRVRPHFFWAMSVFSLYSVRALFWRFGKPEQNHYRATQILFALAGNILIAITAYFGGLMVYAE